MVKSGALEGVVVVEVANFISGPWAGALLGDLGAEVIKVEAPTGDPFRTGDIDDGYSAAFRAFNRNKRSVVIDTHEPAGLETLNQLLVRADVLIQNLRPSTAERLGLTYAALSAANPGLVVCAVSAFGDKGPYVNEPGFDTMGQALSGLLSLVADPSNPRPVGPAMADELAALFAAYGVLAALLERSRTGRGQQVSTSLLAAAAAFASDSILNTIADGIPATPYTRAAASQAFAFRCRDGKPLAIHLSRPEKFWHALLAAVGQTELSSDPRFATRANRIKNYDELYQLLAGQFALRDRDDWLALLRHGDVPCSAVLNVAEVILDPQAEAVGLIESVTHPALGTFPQVANPVSGNVVRSVHLPPPALGEHTAELLAEQPVLPASAART
jgi:crotonobetainyl-CoA:carnitine CoA-transferase CaiB-like acyl-CoA transferase